MEQAQGRISRITQHLVPEETAGFDGLNARDVVIVSYVRTPIGGFNGSLTPLTAIQLGSIAIKGALKKINLDPKHVEEVIMGNVLQANEGQAPARQAALGAGIPNTVPCTTVNKVCASGMKSVMFAASSIRMGQVDVVVAGGMESMTNAPYYLPKARQGYRMGDNKVIDGIMRDGLTDAYANNAMGVFAELCSEKHGIPREQQDAYAAQSFQRAKDAWKAGAFKEEVVPVELPAAKGATPKSVTEDEDHKRMDPSKLPQLRGVFGRKQTVTAGNASTISDGAAAIVLMSVSKARDLGLQPLAVIRGMADAAQAPEEFTTAPALAIPKALKNANVTAQQVDFYEVNEAFSVVCEANKKLLNIPANKINVFGGAVSIGHPIGCSGARIIGTLITVLKAKNGRIGVASICNGGGGASAIVIERL
jgi:acetyl-CoA C-acetyltransferase